MTITLTRQQRRLMQRLGEEADRAVEGDRRFFDRHPARTYRVRLMSGAERQQVEIVQGAEITPAPDQAIFVVMKQLAPGVRMKATVVGPRASIGEELTEAAAACIYERYADIYPAIRDRENAMRAAVEHLSKGQQDGGAA